VQRRASSSGQVVRITALRRGRTVGSSQVLLSGARHAISVAWFAGRDGEAGLWVDGKLAARIASLANPSETIESARLGQISRGNARTRGDLYLDDFRSTS